MILRDFLIYFYMHPGTQKADRFFLLTNKQLLPSDQGPRQKHKISAFFKYYLLGTRDLNR